MCLEKDLEYDIEHILDKPPEHVFKKAKKIKLIHYNEQEHGDPVNFIKKYLSGKANGKPLFVAIGVKVHPSSWLSSHTQETGKILEEYPGERHIGGHAIVITGYKDDESYPGGGYNPFLNSWGQEFGKNPIYTPAGFGIISYKNIRKNCLEAVVLVEVEDELENSEYSRAQEVIPVQPVNNGVVADQPEKKDTTIAHKAYVGMTGSGKTTRIKEDIIEDRQRGHLVLDYHGDFTDHEGFLEAADAAIWHILEDGLPYNIFRIPPAMYESRKTANNGTMDAAAHSTQIPEVAITFHVNTLVGRFKACIPELGGRQINMLRKLIEQKVIRVNIHQQQEVKVRDLLTDLDMLARGEGEVASIATRGKAEAASIANSLLEQLEPILRLGILDYKYDVRLDEIIRYHPNIVFACRLPDHNQNALKLVSAFLISGVFSMYQCMPADRLHPLVIIQDEFHKAPTKDQVYENIVREGRKYNVFLWASSQEFRDVQHLLNNVGERHIFKVANGKEARSIAQFFASSKKLQTGMEDAISRLEPHQCIDPLTELKLNEC